ncbi:MAG: Uma2 family endonuclease [Chloroflexota bacterium]
MSSKPVTIDEMKGEEAPFLRRPASDFAFVQNGALPNGVSPTGASPNGALPPIQRPNVDHLITEDDTPVDNIFSEKEQRLLAGSIHASFGEHQPDRKIEAFANVGLYHSVNESYPLVPDVMASLDVELPDDIWAKRHRSYMIWEYGKAPEIVIEIVSNKIGGEEQKIERYGRMGVAYYVIHDPENQLGNGILRMFKLSPSDFEELDEFWVPGLELGLTLWNGEFEGWNATWLRWVDKDGNLLETGMEREAKERQRAEEERQRAEEEHRRAEEAEQDRERMAAKLRELGIDPDSI